MKILNFLTLILLLLLSDYSLQFKKLRNKSGNLLILKNKINLSSKLKLLSKHKNRLHTEDDTPDQPNCSNSYFGNPFTCLSDDGLPPQNSMVPTTVLGAYTKIYNVMYTLGNNYNFCLGDISGDDLHEEEQISCEGIPLNPDNTYAAMGGVVYDFQCGEEPQTVAACVAFDTCGTFAISVSGGVVRCVSELVPGIGTIVSAISEFLEFVSFGISVDKQFTMPLQIFTFTEDDSAGVVSVTTQGHFYLAAGLAFPQNIFGDIEALKEAISINVVGTFMIDFGSSSSSQIDSINNYNFNSTDSNQNNNNAVSFLQNMLTSGEVAANLNGTLSINLNELTHGILPNLEFDVGELSALITSGGGASGQPAGFYLYAETNLDFFMELLDYIFDEMANLIGLGNIDLPDITSGDNFGIFINENYGGFTFGFTLIDSESITCIYNFQTDTGSCGVRGWFMTFIYQAGKWLINQVEALYGDIIQALGYFDEGINFLGHELEEIGEDIEDGLIDVGDDVGEFFDDIFGGSCIAVNYTQYGGYSQTCWSCTMMNSNSNNYPHYLQCSCQDGKGSSPQSVIDIAQCFGNVNGILAWTKTSCYPTNYYQSCFGCQLNGSVLSCTCKMGSSEGFSDLSASVDLNNFVGNINGNLHCSDQAPTAIIAQVEGVITSAPVAAVVSIADDIGSGFVTAVDDVGDFFSSIFGGGCSNSNNSQYGGYSQSCSSCTMMNSHSDNYPHYLQCNCQNGNGSSQQSTIDIAQCFGNVNGILAWRKTSCYPTNYYQSCLGCQLNGSVLSCTCKMGSSEGFDDKSASVDINNFVGNINGNLKCF